MSLPRNGRPVTRQTRQKPAPTLAVPNIDEDAAERKRVLNVLAQRRYRKRKRDAKLGAEASHTRSTTPAETLERPVQMSSPPSEAGNAGIRYEETQSPPITFPDVADLNLPATVFSLTDTPYVGATLLQWSACQPAGASLMSLSLNDCPDITPAVYPTITFATPPNSTPSTHTSSPPSPNLDLTDNTNTTNNNNNTSDYTTFPPPSSDPEPSLLTATTTFPDSYHLAVPPLTLLRGLFRIATRLNAAASVLSLAATSPFNLGLAPDPSQLPPAWQPTATQLLVPHHPLLDLLPWPSVRDRMIGALSLGAGDGNGEGAGGGGSGSEGSGATGSGLVDFVYDMEDGAEGLRIWGSDPYDEGSWEVGQVLFERWWFVFDKGVVERSNYWRRQRGAAPLRALTI